MFQDEKYPFYISLRLTLLVEHLQALYQVSVLLVLNFRGKQILHLQHETNERAVKLKNTLIFNAFVFCQVRI